jgi:2-dehydro-3-deoxygluconokinase
VLTAGEKGAFALDDSKLYHEPGYRGITPIDRLGAGDAFSAGIIYGWLRRDLGLGLKFGVAMSAMKMGMRGDYFWGNKEEVSRVIESGGRDIRR